MHPFAIGLLVSFLGLFSGLMYGAGFGLQTGLIADAKTGLIIALIFGVGLGLGAAAIVGTLAGTRWLYEQPGYADLHLGRRRSLSRRRVTDARPKRRLTSPIALALFLGVTIAVAGVAVSGVAISLTAGFTAGLVVWLAAWLLKWAESPATTDRAITPVSSWRADRTLILLRVSLTALAFGLALALGSLLLEGGNKYELLTTLTGVLMGAGTGFFFGVILGNHHAWLLFFAATLRIALLGHWLPFRLMPFLDDCHRLGLLRTVGPTYQYRHAELQDYLAINFYRKYRNYLRPDPSVRETQPHGRPQRDVK
jgi:hypothetical protein